MKVSFTWLMIVSVLLMSSSVFAGRTLDRAETLQIIRQLTDHPVKTWIQSGTIQAKRTEFKAAKITDPTQLNEKIVQAVEEYRNKNNKIEVDADLQKMKLDATPFNTRYKLSNEYTMTSMETVKISGEKFLWQTEVLSRTDSVKPGKDLEGNYMTDNFNLDWNSKRISAWDGEKYTMYSAAANSGIVDAKNKLPRGVNGPLTACIVPWGNGYLTYETLSAMEITASEDVVDGKSIINLSFKDPLNRQVQVALDPSKNYAVINLTRSNQNDMLVQQFSNHKLVAGNWVPQTILEQSFENNTNKLLSRNLWEMTVIDSNVPAVEELKVPLKDNAKFEFYSHLTEYPVHYTTFDGNDSEKLLNDKFAYVAKQGQIPQNCATASMQYVAEKLGKTVTSQNLSNLVKQNNSTSLSDLKMFAESLGLKCRAVKTDVKGLINVNNNCKIILHIPHKKHFVVLESVDNNFAKIIDLVSNNFSYNVETNFLHMDWTAGTALLISNQDIEGQFQDIPNQELENITGSAGYSCTRVLQQEDTIFCVKIGELCDGNYYMFFYRLGCAPAIEGGCLSNWEIRCCYTACLNDPWNPGGCWINTENWTFNYVKSCNWWDGPEQP